MDNFVNKRKQDPNKQTDNSERKRKPKPLNQLKNKHTQKMSSRYQNIKINTTHLRGKKSENNHNTNGKEK